MLQPLKMSPLFEGGSSDLRAAKAEMKSLRQQTKLRVEAQRDSEQFHSEPSQAAEQALGAEGQKEVLCIRCPKILVLA